MVNCVFDGLTLLPSRVLFFSLLYVTPLVIFISSCFSVYACASRLMMGLVSCQVSSLLALSVTQRSDKKEPGVGLSLPLAKEVSFSPSIIHILFNLTRYKWPRNAAPPDTVSHLCQTNMDRLVFFLFFYIFIQSAFSQETL